MADNRKYYYLKLKENFFDSDSIVLLEDMKDGILYSNILLKLYLKSLKNGGKLQLDENIPYTAQMIATLTRHQIVTGRRLRCSAPGLWDNLSRSTAGLGSSPTSIFAGPAPCKNFGVWPHPNCLPKRATRNMAQKNGGYAFFYVSSVSLAFCSPSAVASMTVNSFSSIELSSLSICWRQSLSLFCLSG